MMHSAHLCAVHDSKNLFASVQDHFVFTVESTGALTPYDIVRQSIAIMYSKLEVLHRSLEGSDQPAALPMDMNMG